MDIIRVFARKTSMTPTDELAFYDGPPLYDVPDLPVYVSVTFTWDIHIGKRLFALWHNRPRSKPILIGGPALNDIVPGDFNSGLFLKEGITITSRGCPKRCPWCLVPEREGKLREINIAPGHIVQDNNLLACSRGHIERVFEMLLQQKKSIKFLGGLDIDYMKPWHIELFKKIRIGKCGLVVACDRQEDIKRLDKAADLLSDFDIEKKRCCVLVGYNGETQEQAQRRCESVLAKGFLPYAQLYRDTKSKQSRGEWRKFCYFWCHPNLYRKTIGIK